MEDISEADWDLTFRTNIYGYFRVTKAALPHLKAGSAIINCGSITGFEGNKTLIDYATTKCAIHAFTKSLAQNLADRHIRVNCVAPGPIWTPLQPVSKPPKQVAEHGQDTTMKRPGQPEEDATAFCVLRLGGGFKLHQWRSANGPGWPDPGRLSNAIAIS